MESAGKSAWDRLDTEKQKAELKAQISSNQKELSCAYEKLGREYFEMKTNGAAMNDEKDLSDLIREKTKTIDLLRDKLKQF